MNFLPVRLPFRNLSRSSMHLTAQRARNKKKILCEFDAYAFRWQFFSATRKSLNCFSLPFSVVKCIVQPATCMRSRKNAIYNSCSWLLYVLLAVLHVEVDPHSAHMSYFYHIPSQTDMNLYGSCSMFVAVCVYSRARVYCL